MTLRNIIEPESYYELWKKTDKETWKRIYTNESYERVIDPVDDEGEFHVTEHWYDDDYDDRATLVAEFKKGKETKIELSIYGGKNG